MPWEGSDRKGRLPDDWTQRRRAVLRRCGGRCEAYLPKTGKRCPRPATDVDHVVPGDDHSLRNLRGLCAHHHGKKSSQEGAAARRPKGAKKRPPELHPGARRVP